MANMAYCRFQNTVSDLRDCYEALSEEVYSDLSDEERRAANRLIKLCLEIAEDFGGLLDV